MPLECQRFPLILPGDLVSDSKWPSFEPNLEINKMNILSNIHDDYLKNVTSGVSTRFSSDLAWWPCFWPIVFDPKWPSFKHDLKIIKTNTLSKIHDDCLKNVTARVLTSFSFDLARWPSFWPQVTQFQTWPRNHQDKNLSKIHDDCFKNVTAKVLTRFSADLARWPSFLPHVTQFQTWPRNHQDKHIEQDSWRLLQKCDL